MLKEIAVIFLVASFVCSFTLAQEKPEKGNEETIEKVEVEVEQQTEVSVETETLEIWNKVCPVKGNPVEDGTPTVEYDGKLYGFCCPGCDTKFAKNPEKYAKNLNEDGTRFIGRK
jgi:YHS domain-containing protein